MRLRTLEGHTLPVNSVSFSPDRQTLASGSNDKTIRLWDVDTGEHLRTLEGHTDVVYSVAFSPDGNTIASGSRDNTIRLWDVDTSEHLGTLEGHTESVYSVAFSPDGNTIASGSRDNTIRLWVADLPLDIPDANLRAAVEAELGLPQGSDITVALVKTLTILDWSLSTSNPADRANKAISDLTGLEHATNLKALNLSHNSISDITALSGLTILDELNLSHNSISDITLLSGLTGLEGLDLSHNTISDTTVLSGLTGLEGLNLSHNSISDITVLSGLTALERLDLANNSISDITLLSGLTALERLDLANNSISDITPLSGLTALEELRLSNNIISDITPLVSLVEVQTGCDVSIFVEGNPLDDTSINTHLPLLLSRGCAGIWRTKLSFPEIAPVAVGKTFKLDIAIEDVFDLVGWQLNLAFNADVLQAVSVNAGSDFSGSNAFFFPGDMDNTAGSITNVSGAIIGGDSSVTGSAILLSITFEAKAAGEGTLQPSEVRLGATNGNDIHSEIVVPSVIVESNQFDLNGDGTVDVFDLVFVAKNLGQANPQADANGDGVVNIFDIIAVAQHLGSVPQAPSGVASHQSRLHSTMIANWIDMAQAADDGSLAFSVGIANLKRLLASLFPDETALLANYPNPFNPETWIPYHLSNDADVRISIYDSKGMLVRRLNLGRQTAGYYTDRAQAAYWDGKNESGEQAGSGVYFYRLFAGDYSATRKMLILK